MVERQVPDNFTRFQTQERCALKIAAYVFKGNNMHNVIKQVRVAIKDKQRGTASRWRPSFACAPVHKPRVAQAAIRECKFKQFNHQPTIQSRPGLK